MQLAQLYVGAWMAGGVLAGIALLVCNFGRSSTERFDPPLWVSALASGLVWGGMTGVLCVGALPHWGENGSLLASAAAWTVGAGSGAMLQRRAARSSSPSASDVSRNHSD